jgi:hypothetical protein
MLQFLCQKRPDKSRADQQDKAVRAQFIPRTSLWSIEGLAGCGVWKNAAKLVPDIALLPAICLRHVPYL